MSHIFCSFLLHLLKGRNSFLIFVINLWIFVFFCKWWFLIFYHASLPWDMSVYKICECLTREKQDIKLHKDRSVFYLSAVYLISQTRQWWYGVHYSFILGSTNNISSLIFVTTYKLLSSQLSLLNGRYTQTHTHTHHVCMVHLQLNRLNNNIMFHHGLV